VPSADLAGKGLAWADGTGVGGICVAVLVGGTGVFVDAVGVLVEGTEVFVGVAVVVAVELPAPLLGVFVAFGVCDGFAVGVAFMELPLAHRCGSRCGQAALALLDRLKAAITMSGKAAKTKPTAFTGHLWSEKARCC
jgi:hypothetical protein